MLEHMCVRVLVCDPQEGSRAGREGDEEQRIMTCRNAIMKSVTLYANFETYFTGGRMSLWTVT